MWSRVQGNVECAPSTPGFGNTGISQMKLSRPWRRIEPRTPGQSAPYSNLHSLMSQEFTP